jgi:hypothetical protein
MCVLCTYIHTYITYSTGDLVMKDDVSGMCDDADVYVIN